MKVEHILHRKTEGIVAIDISCHLQSAARLMMRNQIAALIVTDSGEPVGLVSERDLVNALADKGPAAADTPVCAAITGPVPAVSRNESLTRAMALMTGKRLRHLPVFENRDLVGVVSMDDLIKYRLEEIELNCEVLPDLVTQRYRG